MAKPTSFDVIVVGSGASGGWACKRLAEAGLKVALLEAGAPQSDQNFSEHKAPFEIKYRDRAPEIVRKTRPIQSHFACDEFNYKWFCNDLDEPYTTPKDKPYHWLGRLRVTGGRTNVWGRGCLRFGELDFKAASRDGYGEDWPLNYRDLAPYYDLIEEYVGIAGMAEGLAEVPDSKFLPPMAMTCQEVLFRNRAKEKLGRTVTPARVANLTKSINGRAKCHYCGPCHRGCVTHSYFNSAFTTVADAVKSGNCTLISNAMVSQVLMDHDRNRATGVIYLDRITHQPREIHARTLVLCAQTYESVRILLNSANPQWCVRALSHGSRQERRGQRGSSVVWEKANAERSESSDGHLCGTLSKHRQRSAFKKLSARLRIRRRQFGEFQLGGVWLWGRLQAGSA